MTTEPSESKQTEHGRGEDYSYLDRLRETVLLAYRTTPFYRSHYGSEPTLDSLRDFSRIPVVTGKDLLRAGGLLACLSERDVEACNGVLYDVYPLTDVRTSLPFAAVENGRDFEHRYTRVESILDYAGLAEAEPLAILTDEPNMYFATDIERLLFGRQLAILLCDNFSESQLTDALMRLEPYALMLVTAASIGPTTIPASCKAVVSFCGRHLFPTSTPFASYDVYCPHPTPWLAVRDQAEAAYRSNELFLNASGEPEPHVFVERGSNGHLLVTRLALGGQPPLLPLIRYDTGDLVERVEGSRFILRPTRTRF